MSKLRVQISNEWWLIYGEPSHNPDNDTAFLISGLTQTALSALMKSVTKYPLLKAPSGNQWIQSQVPDVDYRRLLDGLCPHIVGWRNITDATDHPLEFSPDLLRQVLDSVGVMNTFITSINRVANSDADVEQAQLGN